MVHLSTRLTFPKRISFLIAMATYLLSAGAFAVVDGQIDDFEDGTEQGWDEGPESPNPPLNVATGGPAGAGDNYLENVSIGGVGTTPGKSLVQMNSLQWTGNYTAAEITEIHMQVNVLAGTTPLLTNSCPLSCSRTRRV